MTDRDGLLVRAAALTYLAERVAKAQEATRAEIMATFKPGETGIAALANGVEVGKVTVGRPAVTASFVDKDAFLRWVEENRPDEIVASVRTSYRDAVLAECKAMGDAVTKDGEPVPGVRIATGSASYRPSYNVDHLGEFLDAIRANAILAIEAPNE